MAESRAAERAGNHGDQADADLHGREKPARVLDQMHRDACAPPPALASCCKAIESTKAPNS
jgi:hypothetical protein